MHHAFLCISSLSLHIYNMKVPVISCFVEDGNTRQKLPISFPELLYSPLEFNSNLPTFDELSKME